MAQSPPDRPVDPGPAVPASTGPATPGPRRRGPPAAQIPRRGPRILAAAILALLAFGVHGRTLGYTVFGWDSWALVETSRIESWADFVGTFRESFMDDRFGIAYYRPVLNLSLAFDWALGGADPRAYQASQLAGFVFALLSLHALARRLAGPAHAGAALLACAAFALYPPLWDVIPVACRRHDVLCVGFVALTLTGLLERDGDRAVARGPAWLALTAFAAAGVKETGYMVAPLGALLVGLYSERRGLVRRGLHALRCTLPVFVGLGALTALRLTALGGFGGDEGGSPWRPDAWRHLVTWVLLPQEEQREIAGSGTGALLAGALLVLGGLAAGLWVARARGAAPSARDEARRWARGTALAVGWIALCCAVTSTIGVARIRAWHCVLPQAGFTLAVAVFGAWFAGAWRRGGALRRSALAALALPVFGLGAWQASYAPRLACAATWPEGDRAVRAFLDDLGRRIAAAPDGANLIVHQFPKLAPVLEHGARLQVPTLLAGHSIAAWVRLVFPERRVLVLSAIGADSRLDDGVVVTLATSEVLDASGVFGEFQATLAAMSRDSRQVAPDMRRYREALNLRGDAQAAKNALCAAFEGSAPEHRRERLELLARWFEAIADRDFAARAREAAVR